MPDSESSLEVELSIAFESRDISSRLIQHLRGAYGVSATEVQQNFDVDHLHEVLTQKESNMAEDILHLKSKIQKYEAELRKLKAMLLALESKQEGLNRCSDACKSLLAPIRRLPAELLREIFILSCDKGITLKSAGQYYCPPFKVAAICGSWRALVFSMPQVWTHIEVDARSDLKKGSDFVVNLALELSKIAPLYLRLSGSFWSGPEPASIMTSFARHSHRWHDVTLCLWGDFGGMNALVQDFPLLKSLAIQNSLPLRIVKAAPKLCRLSLIDLGVDLIDLSFPWDQITSFELDCQGLRSSEIVSCIHRCTNLERLKLRNISHSQEPSSHRTLHKIKSLMLLFFTGLEQSFNSFTLPRLTHLSLSSNRRTWTSTDDLVLENFLSRSACTITSLTLSRLYISDNKIISILRRLPSTKVLSIMQAVDFQEADDDRYYWKCNMTNSLLTSLCLTHSPKSAFVGETPDADVAEAKVPPPGPLLPKLREINLTVDYDHSPSIDLLIEFAKSHAGFPIPRMPLRLESTVSSQLVSASCPVRAVSTIMISISLLCCALETKE